MGLEARGQFPDRLGRVSCLIQRFDVAPLDPPIRRPGPRGEPEAQQLHPLVFLDLQNPQELVRLCVDDGKVLGAVQDFARGRIIFFPDRHDREIDDGERLVRFFFQSGVQVFLGGIELAVVQFLTGQIDQHPRGITAGGDRSFQKSPLIFPIECVEKSARAETNSQETDHRRSHWSGNAQP